jgi:hypothetical protein
MAHTAMLRGSMTHKGYTLRLAALMAILVMHTSLATAQQVPLLCIYYQRHAEQCISRKRENNLYYILFKQ